MTQPEMTGDLFGDDAPALPGADERLEEGAVLLRGFALAAAPELLDGVRAIAAVSPWRHMVTPGGFRMSVSMTGAGPLGWTSSRRGYAYSSTDPETGRPWPPIPASFLRLARDAAARGGFDDYESDACLINEYLPGARMSLHQDRDEEDRVAPIVSVSLGLPALFLWGGPQRSDRPRKLPLFHGDVVVWGGPARFMFHGVQPVKPGHGPLLGERRWNITFRQVKKRGA